MSTYAYIGSWLALVGLGTARCFLHIHIYMYMLFSRFSEKYVPYTFQFNSKGFTQVPGVKISPKLESQ